MEIELLNRLRKEAEKNIQKVFDNLENQSEIDEFKGNRRNELIVKFDRFEYHLNEKGENEKVCIRMEIYLENDIWVNSLKPIGKYLSYFDLNGELIDEFITINAKNNFDINYWIEILNKIIPKRYFKRNIPEYELVTYINHSIFLFQGGNFYGVLIFIKRSLDYLEISKNKELINSEYLEKVYLYLHSLFNYLKTNNLVDDIKMEKYNIEKRLKTKS